MDFLEEISGRRRVHIFGTAQEAELLAERWGYDPARARLAALYHDATKEWSLESHLSFCAQYGIMIADTAAKKLLHAQSSALLYRKNENAPEDDVYYAVLRHTTGGEFMSLPDKILYVADKTEPSRKNAGRFRREALEDITRAALAIMEAGIARLAVAGAYIHADTIAARHSLMSELEKNR